MSEMTRSTEWDAAAGNNPVLSQNLKHPYIKLSIDLVDEEVNGDGELLDSYTKGDLAGVIDGVGDTLKVVCQLCYALGIDPEELLKEVNDSNFSKFCTTSKQAIDSIKAYDNDQRYFSVYADKVWKGGNVEYFVIKGWKAGQDPKTDHPKILKAHDYKEFDATKFILDSMDGGVNNE